MWTGTGFSERTWRKAEEEMLRETRMSNVIEFKQPPKPKQPRPPRPGLKKLLIVLGAIAALVLIWAYFQFLG